MKQFLLVFDRSEGRVLSCVEFADRAVALSRRFEAERLHSRNPNIEVVVLGAESKKALMRTHARYFTGAAGLYQRSLDHLAEESGRAVSG